VKKEFVDIINSSLNKEIYHMDWKTSMIISISKIEKPKKANQCNPINMLSIFEKILKLVVKRQLDKYLENSDIITEHQSDFKKDYSCETAI